jgi:hypothetical protein
MHNVTYMRIYLCVCVYTHIQRQVIISRVWPRSRQNVCMYVCLHIYNGRLYVYTYTTAGCMYTHIQRQVVIGSKIPISRVSHAPGKSMAPMKEKTVKFGGTEGPTPAYLRTRGELEERAKRGGESCLCVYLLMYVCVCVCVCLYIPRTHTHANVHTDTYIHTCMRTGTLIADKEARAYIHTYIHTYTYTDIHAYIHAYIQAH